MPGGTATLTVQPPPFGEQLPPVAVPVNDRVSLQPPLPLLYSNQKEQKRNAYLNSSHFFAQVAGAKL